MRGLVKQYPGQHHKLWEIMNFPSRTGTKEICAQEKVKGREDYKEFTKKGQWEYGKKSKWRKGYCA